MIVPSRGARPVLALFAILLIASACGGDPDPAGPPAPEGPVAIIETASGEVPVRIEIADTEEERSRGLMGRESLPEDTGMVFLHEEPQASSFWMKDTLIPLSLAVWDEEGVILSILDMEPCEADPCTIYDPGAAWVGALEVNEGFFADNGVEVGDTIELPVAN